ncbi:uncharacterized protein [Blastocystis hominis]|uniref:Topoisomerase 6 subunit A/Spo11 TOPRIM domain-containing protein n=1 Tax=Blastocystis hominis TaxID=12968 RepID=D8M5Z5_BLAHO|nr:uncharacterized protein [Blastocystis hominis]CBK23594.2 unnamed protein product [Blastocystis hominis]|eukprot:XP_012897642.1 uncharacterized protein [Blastocystis hominis]
MSRFRVYLILQIFSAQRECDDSIQDCIALLRVPRDALGISATSKGYVTGRLFYYPKEEGVWYDMTMEKPHSITYDMINSLEVKSDAQFILVVEKDGIFKRLYEDRFFDILPCVIITGRGFPDIATRAFTHFLAVFFSRLFDIDTTPTPNLRNLRLESVRRCVTDDLHSWIIEFRIGILSLLCVDAMGWIACCRHRKLADPGSVKAAIQQTG